MGTPLSTLRDRLLAWSSRNGPPLLAGAAPRELDRAPASDGERLAPAAIVPEGQPLPPARRLVVLILDGGIHEMELARKVWALASPARLDVLYLRLRCSPDEEAHERLSLANLASLTFDDFNHVHTAVSVDRDWVRAIQSHWRAGDLLVCYAGQMAPGPRLVPKPLAEVLAGGLGLQVVVLHGSPPRSPRRDPVLRFVQEILPFLIVGGMFLLQTRIVRFTQGATQTGLLLLSVIGEFWLIWVWNRSFNLRDI